MSEPAIRGQEVRRRTSIFILVSETQYGMIYTNASNLQRSLRVAAVHHVIGMLQPFKDLFIAFFTITYFSNHHKSFKSSCENHFEIERCITVAPFL